MTATTLITLVTVQIVPDLFEYKEKTRSLNV